MAHLQCGSPVTIVIKGRILTPCTRPHGPSKISSPPPSPLPQPPLSRLRLPGSLQPLVLCPSPPGFAHAFTCLEPSRFPPWLTHPPRLSQAPRVPGCPACPSGLQSTPQPWQCFQEQSPGDPVGLSLGLPQIQHRCLWKKEMLSLPVLETGRHLFRLIFSCLSSNSTICRVKGAVPTWESFAEWASS